MCDSWQGGLVNVSQQSLSGIAPRPPPESRGSRRAGRLTRNKLPPANSKYRLSRDSRCWPAEQSVTTRAAEKLAGSEEQSSCEVPRRASPFAGQCRVFLLRGFFKRCVKYLLFGKEDEKIIASQGPIVEIPLDWLILRTIRRHLQPPMLLQHINVSEPQCWVHWTIHYSHKTRTSPCICVLWDLHKKAH
jgi:hypothetical protein